MVPETWVPTSTVSRAAKVPVLDTRVSSGSLATVANRYCGWLAEPAFQVVARVMAD